MAQAFVEDPPYIKHAKIGRVDFAGFALLAVWLGTLQVILDKGQQEDWFASEWIRWFAVISALCFLGFVVREVRTGHPIVNLHILRNRNFATGVLLITTLGAVLYGTTAALPIFLQTEMGYPAMQSGMTLSPRGLGAFVTTFIVGRLVGRVRNRILITIGFALLAASSFWLAQINLQISMWNVILPSVLNGVAISFIFTPLTTAAVGHLQQAQMGNATGIYNLMRNLGGSHPPLRDVAAGGEQLDFAVVRQQRQHAGNWWAKPARPCPGTRHRDIPGARNRRREPAGPPAGRVPAS